MEKFRFRVFPVENDLLIFFKYVSHCNQMWSKMTKLVKNGQLKLKVVKGNLGSCQTGVIFRKMIPDGREWPLPCLTLMWLPYFKKSFKLSWVTVRNHVINQKSSNMYCVIPLRLIQYLDIKIIGSAISRRSRRKQTIFWPKADDLGESRRSCGPKLAIFRPDRPWWTDFLLLWVLYSTVSLLIHKE